jgi:hypothetical protein
MPASVAAQQALQQTAKLRYARRRSLALTSSARFYVIRRS